MARSYHIGLSSASGFPERTDKVRVKWSLGTEPRLSSLGALWVIARCHWVKLASTMHCISDAGISACPVDVHRFPKVIT